MLANTTLVGPVESSDQTAIPGSRRGTVLIVDDEEGPRQTLRVVLKGDYGLHLAEDGNRALEIARTNEIDVAILDLRMGGMNGIEVLFHLKTLDPDIQVIMLTAYETIDTARHALRLRACDYLNKPFDISTMRAAVAEAMQSRRILRLIRTQGGVDRSILDHHLAELTRLRFDAIRQDWHVTSLERETAELRSKYQSVAQKYKSLVGKDDGVAQGAPAKILGSAKMDTFPADVGSELSAEVLTNTTIAFIHKLNNEYVNLARLIGEIKAETDRVVDATGTSLRERAGRVLCEIKSTRYLLERFRNAMGRHPGVLRPIAIKVLLADVVQHLQDRLKRSVTTSMPDRDCKVKGDQEMLWHLFENLIRNALEATEGSPDGNVSVIVQRSDAQDQLIIEVHDTGAGIAKDKLGAVFQMNYSTKPKGMGIGLYLARHAAQIHGGSIRCQSELGKGTTFTVSLPCATP
jgi:signal transduction histidine kinase